MAEQEVYTTEGNLLAVHEAERIGNVKDKEARPASALPPRRLVFWALWLGAAALVAAGYAWANRPRRTLLCHAEAVPEAASSSGNAWYWLERTPAGTLLVRAGNNRRVIARARAIESFSQHGRVVTWAESDGEKWRVVRATPEGTLRHTVWEGSARTPCVWTDGGRIAWLLERPMPKRASRFAPALGPRTEVWLHDGRKSRMVAELAEKFYRSAIVGMYDEALYVLGTRDEGIRTSVVYEVGPSGAHRILSEVGPITARLMSGNLYWTAPSRESNYALDGCIMVMKLSSGETRMIADWLPAGGNLYRHSGRWLICGGASETAWRIDEERQIGEPVRIPGDQWPIAADGRGLLTVLRRKTPGKVVVSIFQL